MATNNEELLHVNEDLRGIYTELFLGDDSDEDFEGFHLEDIESSDSHSDTNLDSWEIGDREPSTLNFTGTRGLQAHLPENPEIIDFVKLFLNDGDFKIISEETNRYASSYLQQAELRSHSRLKRWPTDGVTCDDVKCFIALTIAMGLTVQEDLGEYWSTDPIMQTPFYPSIMSRDFFMNILSFLHLSDNRNYILRGQRGYNPLFKLGEVYDNILTRFKTVWYPGQHVCIDEGMIPFRGKVHMRVYAPDKPDKYGLKSYELCDSENAYCCVFRLYTGKTEQAVSKHGRTYDLVMSLMHDYLRKGHILYIDNYYTSPQLLMDLHKKGTGATGTARNRKGFPPAVRDAKLSNKGDKIVMSNGPMMAMKIKDRKDVKMLSTVHSSTDVDTAKRNHRGVAIRRCEAVHMYNQFMEAVDRNDQMVAYSSFRRRTLKWWKKVFFHVLSLAILNSWIVYRDWCQSKRVSPVLQRVFRWVLTCILYR